MEISIGIVSYNSVHKVKKLIKSLNVFQKTKELKINLFLIENGKDKNLSIATLLSDETKPQFVDIKIIDNNENLGFGGGHNKIASNVGTDIYYIVNPDIEFVDANVFAVIEEEFKNNERLNFLSPGIQNPQGNLQLYNKFDPTVWDMVVRFTPGNWFKKRKNAYVKKEYGYMHSQTIEFASGAFLAVKLSSFKQVGGFDDRYFLYFEDADLSRALRLSGEGLYMPEIRVQHDWERASRKNLKYLIILVESMIKYFGKWGWKWA